MIAAIAITIGVLTIASLVIVFACLRIAAIADERIERMETPEGQTRLP